MQKISDQDADKDEKEYCSGDERSVSADCLRGVVACKHAAQKRKDDEEVFSRYFDGAHVLFRNGMHGVFGRGAHVSRAERRGEGFPLHFAEVVELDSRGKGDKRIDEHIRHRGGQEGDRDQDGDLAQKNKAVPSEFVALLFGEVQAELAQKHARDEQKNGGDVAQCSRAVSRCEIEREEDEVARLRVAEHAAARHVSIGVKKSACDAKENTRFHPFKYGIACKFFPIVLHGTDCTRSQGRCQPFLAEILLHGQFLWSRLSIPYYI